MYSSGGAAAAAAAALMRSLERGAQCQQRGSSKLRVACCSLLALLLAVWCASLWSWRNGGKGSDEL